MTSRVSNRPALLVLAAVALLVLGVVGGHAWAGRSDPAAGPGATGSPVTVGAVARRASATDHNGADVDFARSMTPHHTQAVEMARLARTRAGSPRVKALAATIEAAQGPEIRLMTGWLAAWGEADRGSVAGMAGMMSKGEMASLAAERGAAFDRDFLTMMIGHHTGAIAMAHDELVGGRSAGALGLATSVQVTQQAEVAQMRTMLRRLS